MKDDLPLVTVLIPARNEEADIVACLDAVLAQDWPHDRLEVILVDGASTDATVEIARGLLGGADLARWQVLENAAATTPSNLNVGLAAATGAHICRVDSRSLVQPDHVRRCSDVLRCRPEVAVVGGAQVARPAGRSPREIGIARALNNPWATGLARYRRAGTSGPTETVYLGAFRRCDLLRCGGWDPRFHTNQDFELNQRLRARGDVWFDAGLRTPYTPRRTVRSLFAQYHRFGRWKVRFWRVTGRRPVSRQVLALASVPVAAATFIGLFVLSGRRLRLVSSALALAIVFEDRGTTLRRGGLVSRGFGLLAALATTMGWWTGALREAVLGGARDPG